ncbi:MAG TPA: preprotein translocase subunit SecY [Candidatus Aminicenantes bacterium]|nr:preprotein translocase subunit SecY [Candidatus Aminicenantes bacterium]
MITFLRNIFVIPELRKRVVFTFLMLAVYRIGSQIVIPGINIEALQQFFEQNKETFLGFLDMFSGRNMSRMTIFALGIMPYISASIILQLLQVVWPYLERISKEGELGRRKITQYTRYGTVLICLVQAFGIAIALEKMNPSGLPVVLNPGWGFRFVAILTLTTGTVFIMWLGEQISERGIGNGISLIIFAGIVIGLVPSAVRTVQGLGTGDMSPIKILFLLALMLAVIGFIVFVEMGQRRIPVSYAKRIQGRRMYGGQSTFLPLKVNTGGVIPIIFASSVITFPATIAGFVNHPIAKKIAAQLGFGMPLYTLLYVTSIIFFTYFYVSIIFNPKDVADNLQKHGGFIPGIRAGKNTSAYIDNVLSKLTFVGAIYLALIALIPEFLMTGFRFQALPWIGDWLDLVLPGFVKEGLGVQFYFGGTSILIVVGVAMDTVQQIEAQLTMRNYDSFSRKGRIRGRRG